jgi:hypothetical protein
VLRSVDDACLDCQCLHRFRCICERKRRPGRHRISRWEINHALHASSASRRAARLLSRKTGLPFPPHRAPAAAHSPSGLTPSARRPSRSSRSRSLYTSEASHLSLSLSVCIPPSSIIPLSQRREGSDWRLAAVRGSS